MQRRVTIVRGGDGGNTRFVLGRMSIFFLYTFFFLLALSKTERLCSSSTTLLFLSILVLHFCFYD